MVAGILVELSARNIDKEFDYNIPSNLKDILKVGMCVKVPFGRMILEGIVLEIKEENLDNLKDIIEILDEEIYLNEELLTLGKKMKEKTYSTLISCYDTMLPKALKAKTTKKVNIKYDTFYKLGNVKDKLTKKQEEVVNLFKDKDLISRKEILEVYKNIKDLVNNNILIEVKKEHYRLKYLHKEQYNYTLTEDQQLVYDEFINSNDSIYLLHGVTGSGKTEVYMKIIDYYLKQGKTAIVLVPEISLTPQMVNRFTSHFGNIIAALHSALSEGEKYDEYRRIYRNEAKIVIGARSALFCPLKNIGVIIIDEEHSTSYKQDDKNPHYSAVDMAIERTKLNNAKLLLGSATPSLETYAKSLKGIYHLLTLSKRVNNMNLPDVKIVDMNYAIRNSIGHFSKDLIDEINDRLSKKEQVILLLNRRGYDTVVSCKNCGYTYKCPNCDITLTYHKSSNNLRCHYCGYAAKLDINCPKCHERSLNGIGTGTEKIEEELNKLFKQAKVLRMDFDTTTKKGSHEKLIESFKKKEYDILIGTQIVAKGLDFDDVTLVGIINADTSLNIPNYRSSEETFELLSQTAGRSGRKKHGTVILQTYNKDHYAIRYTKSHDYLNFFKEEMNIRREMKYPPYYYLIYIKIGGKDNNYVYKEALKIKKSLDKYLTSSIILGPISQEILKVNNKYNYGIIIKYKKEPNLDNTLNLMIDAYKSLNKIKVEININPMHF